MRTRAQASRDAALRRLTRVNHGLTAAAAIGAGVLTEVVAHTASAHTHRVATSSGRLAAASSGSTTPGGAARTGERLARSSAPAAVTTRRRASASRSAKAKTSRPAQRGHDSATVTHPSSTVATQQQAPAPAQQQQQQAPAPAPVVVSGGS